MSLQDFEKAFSSINDTFESAAQVLEKTAESFNGSSSPSTIGFGTRQSKLPDNRVAVDTRNIIHWLVPEGPIIQMYINPKSISANWVKDVPDTRTKGGFVIQYFGPKLLELNIRGTTGTSGIEGINVLYDLYRYEQLAMDPYALANAAANYQNTLSNEIFGENNVLGSGEDFANTILSGSINQNLLQTQVPPSLADIAFKVEMYYSGLVYRGYFTSFSVEEQSENLGFFDYTLNFKVTQQRGFRQNFLAWHRSPNEGPSHTDPVHGVPYSFSSLQEKG